MEYFITKEKAIIGYQRTGGTHKKKEPIYDRDMLLELCDDMARRGYPVDRSFVIKLNSMPDSLTEDMIKECEQYAKNGGCEFRQEERRVREDELHKRRVRAILIKTKQKCVQNTNTGAVFLVDLPNDYYKVGEIERYVSSNIADMIFEDSVSELDVLLSSHVTPYNAHCVINLPTYTSEELDQVGV